MAKGQIITLIFVMGKEAEHAFINKSFVFAENYDSKKSESDLTQSDENFGPKRNIIHERAKFHRCSQNQGGERGVIQSLKRSTFPFLRSFTVRSPSDHRALIVRSSFTVLRSAFTVRSRSPFTKRSAFAHRFLSFTYRSQSVHHSFSVQSSLSFGTLKLKDQYHDLGTK